MPFIVGAWSLGLNETLFVLAVILIVVDFFCRSDVLTHVAYMIFAVLIGVNIHVHLMYRILICLLAWFAIIALHYLLWRRCVQRLVNKLIAPDKYKDGADGLVGLVGEIKEVEQQKMVMVKGDLWPIGSCGDVRAGEKGKVVKVENGILIRHLHYARVSNPVTGDYTAVLRMGLYRIENGEVKYALKKARILDNIIKMISNVDEVGSDLKVAGSWGRYAIAPTMRISKVRIVPL